MELVNDGENVVFAHHQVFFAVNTDFRARILVEKHKVASFHRQSGALAVIS